MSQNLVTLSLSDAQLQAIDQALTDLEAQLTDLVALDRLRPRLLRLKRVTERASDTEVALGSDVMTCALQGYALLKVAGKNQGLEGLRRSLGKRFKVVRTAEEEAAEEPMAA